MRVLVLIPLAALLFGCISSPDPEFADRFDLHVILRALPPPPGKIALRPVCTLGRAVRKPTGVFIGPNLAPSEIALFRAPAGPRRFAFWDAALRAEVRATLDVDHDLWVVVTLGKGRYRADLKVYRKPPHGPLGAWRPLVAVPD